MAAGESIIKAIKHSLDNHCPFILCASSGGARMQEGILSLMQMPRTTIMIQALRKEIPYIVLLTNPTTGGVTASYAMLGDIHIAEPNALIGFAGPRVIQDTIKENLPDGFQKSEYLLDHGMIDMVSHRKDLKNNITSILEILMNSETQKSASI